MANLSGSKIDWSTCDSAAKLITESIELWGFFGIIILFLVHIWMDYVWLYIVAFFASKTSNLISNRNYKILIISLTMILIYFGIEFLREI